MFSMGGQTIRNVALVIGFALTINFINEHLYTKLPVTVSGDVEPGFEDVKVAFVKNFNDGWEREGAAFVVYKDGKKVVDLWGGYADKQAARKWKEDTITVSFSTTKAVAAVCVALLVERGHLKYDDLVSKNWPDFAKNGKHNITVQMVLSHTAGLAWLDTQITEEIAADADKMMRILENEKPKWPPGMQLGYHAYTYGWLVDQIIRHSDPKKRSIGTFFKEELAEKFDIDFHIGLDSKHQHRVARISVPPMSDRLSEVMNDWKVLKYFRALWDLMNKESPLSRTVGNPNWLQAVMKCTVNNPDYHRLEQAAALGIGNARSLAKLMDLVSTGHVLAPATLDYMHTPYINETDFIMKDKLAKANGLLFLPLNRAGVEFTLGHTGHGCQQVQFDRKNQITIAYTTNGLKTGLNHLCRTFSRLHDSVYDIFERQHGQNN